MQIVIDIPEKYLNSNIIDVALFTGANNTITDVNVEDEYAEFRVLPKGHGELIDRQAIIDNGIEKGFCDWYDEIKYAPTIIEADKGE